jgi:hypothetical protein
MSIKSSYRSMRSNKGVALISVLLLIVIVGGILTLMFSRTQLEIQHSRDDAAITQTLILARGGAIAGTSLLQGDISRTAARQFRGYLFDDAGEVTESRASSTARFSYGCGSTGSACSNTSIAPDPAQTAADLDAVAASIQTDVNDALCTRNFSPDGTSTVTVKLFFTNTACSGLASQQSLPTGIKLPEGRWVTGQPRGIGDFQQVYALPFVLISEARLGEYKRNLIVQGEYRLTFGRGNFAKYAYFSNIRTTDGQQAGSGNVVWFSNNELIDGPVHSNEYLRFASYTNNNTRAWFGEQVTVAGCRNPSVTVPDPTKIPYSCGLNSTKNGGDYFMSNSGTLRTANAIPNYCRTSGVICPEFAGVANFDAAYIPLPVNNNEQRTKAIEGGLFVGDQNNSSNSKPVKDLQLSTRTVGSKTYQLIRVEECSTVSSCSSTTVTEYRYTDDRILQKRTSLIGGWDLLSSWTNVRTDFNGMIFVDKQINSLGGPVRTSINNPATAAPALTDFAEITVASTGAINITRDLKYTDPPCTGNPQRVNGVVVKATCDNLDAGNILGVYSQNGNVLFGDGTSSTLQNLTVHGVVMSATGRVGTNGYGNNLGSMSDLRLLGGVIGNYVAGFASSTGYRRVFTYDRRMLDGKAPPFFPTVMLDQLQSVFVFTYGQREQVY